MTLTDFFAVESSVSLPFFSILLTFFVALFVGALIYFVYQRVFAGVMYSKPFHMSLLLLTLLTTFVILGVRFNVVLSLGMVGALSIVRFRTAIKDPLDLVFLFWSLSAGILVGAGLFVLSILGTVFIGVLLLALATTPHKDSPYILLVDVEQEQSEVLVQQRLQRLQKKVTLRSKSIAKDSMELIYEIRLRGSDAVFVNELSAISGVCRVSLVSYNGEYAA